jgi:exopolysaccharide biosynthesis polyprenyl glycosylphosphotransferase
LDKRMNLLLLKLGFLLTDLALINLGYVLAFVLKFGWDIPHYNFVAYISTWPWLSLSALCFFCFYRLYGSYHWRWTEVFASLVCVVFFQALAAMALSFFFRGFSFPRTVLLTAPFIQLALLALWRRAAWYIERRIQATRRVIVAGKLLDALALAEKLESATGRLMKVEGVVIDVLSGPDSTPQPGQFKMDGRNPGAGSGAFNPPVLGEVEDICKVLVNVEPEEVFVCSTLSQEQKARVVHACVDKDITVSLVPDLYEIMLARVRLKQVDDVPVFTIGHLSISLEYMFLKRVTDIALSLLALVLTAPLCLLVGAAVKLDSRGPVLYRQKRLTLQGKPFYLYKFRTMVDGAERESGPVLATENDPRLTRVGRLIRAARIDEIPQLINVLKGDMSIVGPRPERPFFVNELVKEIPEYAYRMNIKSGITGLAQISGRYSTTAENKLKYDLLYTKSYSPARDLAILLQTIKVILMKDRAS